MVPRTPMTREGHAAPPAGAGSARSAWSVPASSRPSPRRAPTATSLENAEYHAAKGAAGVHRGADPGARGQAERGRGHRAAEGRHPHHLRVDGPAPRRRRQGAALPDRRLRTRPTPRSGASRSSAHCPDADRQGGRRRGEGAGARRARASSRSWRRTSWLAEREQRADGRRRSRTVRWRRRGAEPAGARRGGRRGARGRASATDPRGCPPAASAATPLRSGSAGRRAARLTARSGLADRARSSYGSPRSSRARAITSGTTTDEVREARCRS